MLKVNLSEAKEQLETLIEAALKGETVIIVAQNEHIRLTVEEKQPEVLSKRFPGSAKGLIALSDDFDAPITDFADYL
jgi:antitoxin (DNA-binding transcriptional repressor) of toxin-antitoxin stability system